MKTKTKQIITQIKHIFSNANYKIRFNNLKKKYDELEEENKRLSKFLSKDYINMQLRQAQQETLMYKRQRDQVRQDYIELQKSITSKES